MKNIVNLFSKSSLCLNRNHRKMNCSFNHKMLVRIRITKIIIKHEIATFYCILNIKQIS